MEGISLESSRSSFPALLASKAILEAALLQVDTVPVLRGFQPPESKTSLSSRGNSLIREISQLFGGWVFRKMILLLHSKIRCTQILLLARLDAILFTQLSLPLIEAFC